MVSKRESAWMTCNSVGARLVTELMVTTAPPTPSHALRVFLIEDNDDLREEIIFGLGALGLNVRGFRDASALYRALSIKDCDIVVIDVGLPGEDGFSIARHLRENPDLGIVFLTARATLDDRLLGLGLGADAYLVKPVDVRELAATLQALGRRLNTQIPAAVSGVTPRLPSQANTDAMAMLNSPIPCWSLSASEWALRNPQGAELAVSETEQRFLKIMVNASGQVVHRETLITAFAQDDDDYDPHRLDAVISRLRKRCDQAGLGSLPLQSIRGMGYVFNA